MYSQHKEDEFIIGYLKEYRIGCPKIVMEIGACDGMRISNSRMFAELGWNGHLIEPLKSYYADLHKLYKTDKKVITYNCAIGAKTGKMPFKITRVAKDHSHLTKLFEFGRSDPFCFDLFS